MSVAISRFYAADLLESMRKSPENHKKEWGIWQEMVKQIADDYES